MEVVLLVTGIVLMFATVLELFELRDPRAEPRNALNSVDVQLRGRDRGGGLGKSLPGGSGGLLERQRSRLSLLSAALAPSASLALDKR